MSFREKTVCLIVRTKKWWQNTGVAYSGIAIIAVLLAYLFWTRGGHAPVWHGGNSDLVPGSTPEGYDPNWFRTVAIDMLAVAVPYTIVSKTFMLRFIVRHVVTGANRQEWSAIALVLSVVCGLFIWGVALLRWALVWALG